MSVQEKVFNDRKNRYEEINRFRNGGITQHLNSVDTEGVVRTGECIVEILEGFICDNLEYNPPEKFIIHMTKRRKRYKKGKKILLQTITKNAQMLYTVLHWKGY